MQFSSIWPIDRTLSSATTPSQSGPGSNGNEVVLYIPQSSSIAETSTSDCLVLYPGHSLMGGSYPSAEVQLVYSTTPANWAKTILKQINLTLTVHIKYSFNFYTFWIYFVFWRKLMFYLNYCFFLSCCTGSLA